MNKQSFWGSIFESFPHPQIILDLPNMDIVLKNIETDSPDDIVNSYLLNHNLRSKVSAEVFSECILKNPVFYSQELILGAEKILKASKPSKEVLENIVSLSFRYIHSIPFQKFIDSAYQKSSEINPFLETYIIEGLNQYSSLPDNLEYIGNPILDDNYRLVTNLEDLLRIENQINNYSGEFWNQGIDTERTWDRMTDKELFVLFIDTPEPVIFKISKNTYMQWFEIEEAITSNYVEISEELITQMAAQIIKSENQFFFQQNYLHNYPVDDFHFPHPRKYNHLFQAGQGFLEEIKKTDQTLEVRELKITDNKPREGLFQHNKRPVSESLYNKIKMNISNMFVELETDQSYLLSKIGSRELLNELIRRKSDDFFNYCMASLDKDFLKESSLKKTGDQANPGDHYEAMFKNLLLKLNMSELTKATQEAGVSAVLVNINKEIQTKTTEEILEAIPEMDCIKSFLENKGCYVKTKEELNGYSLFKFLCDRLGVSYFTDKSSLLEMLQDQLNEPAF
ncbi:hypothetical protein [Marinilabilia salmonicolor]|uniref:hypothetical protein n=1 Tax=Marinilabilia salmonicolor TaxID=989 RepID=UPI00029AFCF9|nr:hypothetical protein [Marinilabilia salmonicolor]